MMSKNLYLDKWKENTKRRGWSFSLCLFVMLVAYPLAALLRLTSHNNAIQAGIQNGISEAELETMRMEMQNGFNGWLGISAVFAFLAAFFAILFAVQGFSWLYSRKKTDLYMSVPVSGPKRFVLLWANGIIVFGAACLIGLLLSFGAGAAFGVMNTKILAYALKCFVFNMLAFTAMYHLALTAVMMTGNALTALLGCCVFFIYEAVVRFFYTGLKSMFFAGYCRADAEKFGNMAHFTPFSGYIQFSDQFQYLDGRYRGMGKEFFMLLLAAVLFGALAYFLFRKRKTESYGRAIAFPAVKPVIELLLLIPFAMGIGILLTRLAGQGGAFLFAGATGGALAGHMLIQLIYERDFLAAVRRWPLAVSCAAFAILLLSVFQFDLTGYDSFVPDREDIAGLAVTMENDYSYMYYQEPFISDRWGKYPSTRLLEKMDTQNPETIDAVLSMVNTWRQNRDNPNIYDEYPGRTSVCWNVRYRMKNGRSVYRRFYVIGPQSQQELDIVMQDESYKKTRYQLYDDAFAQALPQMKLTYSDGIGEILYTADKNELREALIKDFENYSYALITGEDPVGRLDFVLKYDSEETVRTWQYPVYPSFENTIALLAGNDIETEMGELFIEADDIKTVIVNYTQYGDSGDGIFEDSEMAHREFTASFTEPDEIRKLVPALYPEGLGVVAEERLEGVDRDDHYKVKIVLTDEAIKRRMTSPEMFFLKGREPEILAKKIKEAAGRG